MNQDDKFDAFLAREAARLDEPPAVPREAMWEAIAAARSTRRTSPVVAPSGEPTVVPITAARPRRALRHAPWLGMAATLLLGVGIGRYALQRVDVDGARVDPTAVAAGTSAPADAVTPEPTRAEPVADVAAGLGESPPATSAVLGVRRPVTQARTAGSRVAQGPAPTTEPSVAPGRAPGVAAGRPGANRTYVVASNEHLTRAEALVAVVSAMPADAMMDSLTGRWARDILQNTRLLLDSPAGADPVRRRLLEDLENVLVQLVQRSGRTVEDKAMIDRTLQRTQLLTRLRSGATGT